MKALPKVFGMAPSVQAKVIRHVGREVVPKEMISKADSPFGSLRKTTANRESVMPTDNGLDDTNNMEMSIRQVVEVRKITSTTAKH